MLHNKVMKQRFCISAPQYVQQAYWHSGMVEIMEVRLITAQQKPSLSHNNTIQNHVLMILVEYSQSRCLHVQLLPNSQTEPFVCCIALAKTNVCSKAALFYLSGKLLVCIKEYDTLIIQQYFHLHFHLHSCRLERMRKEALHQRDFKIALRTISVSGLTGFFVPFSSAQRQYTAEISSMHFKLLNDKRRK